MRWHFRSGDFDLLSSGDTRISAYTSRPAAIFTMLITDLAGMCGVVVRRPELRRSGH